MRVGRFRRKNCSRDAASVASKAAVLSAPSSLAACCRRSGFRAVRTTLAPSPCSSGRFESDAGAPADHDHGLPEQFRFAPDRRRGCRAHSDQSCSPNTCTCVLPYGSSSRPASPGGVAEALRAASYRCPASPAGTLDVERAICGCLLGRPPALARDEVSGLPRRPVVLRRAWFGTRHAALLPLAEAPSVSRRRCC